MDEFSPTRTSELLASGVARRELAGVTWQRPFRGVAVRDVVDLADPTERIRAVLPLLEPGSVLTGWAAAHLQGVTMLDGRDRSGRERPVTVASPDGGQHRKRRGVAVTRKSMLAGESTWFDGSRVATITRAVYDEALDARTLTETVVAMDMAVSTVIPQARTTVANLDRLVSMHVKTRGIVRVRQALTFTSSRSASPWESRTRMLAVRGAGLRGLRVNVPVFSLSGNLLGIADLIDPASGLIIESDGAHHRTADTHADDNRREEEFERAGGVVCRLTSVDHRDENAAIDRIVAAHWDARRSAAPRWTLERPPWWRSWAPGRRWDSPLP